MNIKMFTVLSLLLCCLLIFFQNASVHFSNVSSSIRYLDRPQPPSPIIKRDVHLIDNMNYTTPVIPAIRTSVDGRIGISMKGNKNKLFLFRPEQLTEHVLTEASPGIKMLESTSGITFGEEFDSAIDNFMRRENLQIDGLDEFHRTLCDATPKNGYGNPKSCGIDGRSDCYYVALITYRTYLKNSQTKNRRFFRLFSIPLEIEVRNPKTASAKITKIAFRKNISNQLTDFKAGPEIDQGVRSFFEPIITQDGRFLMGRFSDSALSWSRDIPNSPNLSTMTNIGYLYQSQSDKKVYQPCDISQWTRVYPISHAPYHAAIKASYGFARYPFRDPVGNIIPDGSPFLATYPWIDKSGSNMMFAAIANDLFRKDESAVVTEYPQRCIDSQCVVPKNSNEIRSVETTLGRLKSTGFVGSWTHGKMIIFDSSFNNTEYGIGATNKLHREIQLYTDKSADGELDPQWVRIGLGRDTRSGIWQNGAVENTTFMESFENVFNQYNFVKPRRIGDVVWTVTTGRTTDDVVFDDYINPHTFIASDMNAAFSMIQNAGSEIKTQYVYYNERPAGIKLQNSATSSVQYLNIPQFGEVSGVARVEPVAMGGVRGKGFYLFDDTNIKYKIPNDRDSYIKYNASPWYTGLFIDIREQKYGQLIRFPDNSSVFLRKMEDEVYLIFKNDRQIEKIINVGSYFSDENSWNHLGIQSKIGPSGRVVELLINGLLVDEWASDYFRLKFVPNSYITFGNYLKSTEPTNGWIDEIRVIAQELNSEIKCNLAKGTLLKERSSNRVVCYSKINDAKEVNRFDILLLSDSYDWMRDKFLFPEGNFKFFEPRPNSRNNQFCLSCHTPSIVGFNRPTSLSLHALSRGNIESRLDHRRQPMQPPQYLRGIIPNIQKTDPNGIGNTVDSLAAP